LTDRQRRQKSKRPVLNISGLRVLEASLIKRLSILMNLLRYMSSHKLTSGLLVYFIVVLLLSLLSVTLAQTATPLEMTLRVGGISKPISAKNSAGQDINPRIKSYSQDGIVEFNAASKTFKAIKEGETTAKMEFTENGQAVNLPDIKITVLPKIENYLIKYDGAEYKNTDTVRISQGVQWPIQVSAVNANDEIVENVTATVKAGTDKLEISPTPPYVLTAKSIGSATLNLKTADDEGQDFTVQVLAPISSSSLSVPDVRVPERGSRTYTPVIKTTTGDAVEIGDKAYGVKINLPDNDYVRLKDADTLVAQTLDVGEARPISARLHLPAVSFGASTPLRPHDEPFNVIIDATGAYMFFVPPTQPLLPNGSVRIDAYFKERSGAPSSRYHVVDWSVDPKFEKYVALAEEGNSVIVIRLDDESAEEDEPETERNSGVREQRTPAGQRQPQTRRSTLSQRNLLRRLKRPSVIPIVATAQAVGGSETIRGEAYVQLREVTKFQPLSVKLNVMDQTTAKDLYGRVAADEYYILMVRLFNDLRDDETKKYTGASIIVYSGSIEVAVNLEKQYDKKSNSAKRKAANPTPSPTDSYISDGRWYEVDPLTDIQDAIADNRYVNNTPTTEDITLNFNDDPVCEDTITYRPLMFEMVVNTVDRRESRSIRARVFSALELVGIGTSFSSAIRFPRPGRDLPIISDRFTNLLVPGLEKIFPSLKEQHRQNIVSQVMKPIEEVPFGSDITRVLFIPRRALRGIIPDHKVRISQICPYYFKIKVAVVDKTGQTVVEQGVRR
jgi:hypothetical protein